MARPIKYGLDYYSKDVTFFSDRKVKRLLKDFGAKGYTIYDFLLCEIYRDKGYFVRYDDDLAFDVADTIGCGITQDLVNEVVAGCIRYDLFDKRLFDVFRVLTSSGIQKRYVNAKKTGVISEEMRVIEEETPVITTKSTQSKVKKSKGNNPAITPVSFEAVKIEITGSQRWVEDNSRHFKIAMPELMSELEIFLTELNLKDDYHKGIKDIKNHFVNWLKLRIDKRKSKQSFNTLPNATV